MQTNTTLTSFNVAWNGFYLDGCKALAKALQTNRTLQVLDLTCNRINRECLLELMRGVAASKTLTTLLV